MATSKRLSNGRSPLVNQQRQITSFFSKTSSSSSPSPSPSSVLSKQTPISNTMPKPNRSPSPSNCHSPVTPSPKSKRKKPLLVIGQSSSSPNVPASDSATTPEGTKRFYREEVVNRRVRVYWPLDKSWYEGSVLSFDKISGKHLILYDDAEEELLDLMTEEIEWVEQPARKLRRLRRASVPEDEEPEAAVVEDVDNGADDDSADEDWGKNVESEALEDASEGMDLEYDSDEDDGMGSSKRKKSKNTEARKRKISGGGKIDSSKKAKDGGNFRTRTCKVPQDGGGGKCIEPKDNDRK